MVEPTMKQSVADQAATLVRIESLLKNLEGIQTHVCPHHSGMMETIKRIDSRLAKGDKIMNELLAQGKVHEAVEKQLGMVRSRSNFVMRQVTHYVIWAGIAFGAAYAGAVFGG